MNKNKNDRPTTSKPSLPPALLILGPTGSGKTPLGIYFESQCTHPTCIHFDFGEQLRRAEKNKDRALSSSDHALIHRLLHKGALLEDNDFHIAHTLLKKALSSQKDDCLVILNGLPRHIGQAQDVDKILYIDGVITLECPPEISHQRIAKNSGGDRTNRIDDSLERIEQKWIIYKERTRPLLDYYKERRVPIYPITVDMETTPADIVDDLNEQGALAKFRLEAARDTRVRIS